MKKFKKNVKQILALFSVALLVALIIATFVVAVVDSLSPLFYGLLFTIIGLPILLWIWLEIYRWFMEKKELSKHYGEIPEEFLSDSDDSFTPSESSVPSVTNSAKTKKSPHTTKK